MSDSPHPTRAVDTEQKPNVSVELHRSLAPIFVERMNFNQTQAEKGYDQADEDALAFLAKGAKEHPQLAKHLLDCANKIHEGVFTDVNIDYTDNSTGKKRLARIDKDDASQILADKKRMDEFASRKAQLQAEWDKIEKEMVEGDGSKS